MGRRALQAAEIQVPRPGVRVVGERSGEMGKAYCGWDAVSERARQDGVGEVGRPLWTTGSQLVFI